MATHTRLVNKQFNSPIGLYSAQNVQEVLEREAQILGNGAVGINFHNPDVGKPANLKNSAVLRMLEEEETRQRNGYGPGIKKVAWPPNESGLDSPYVEQNSVSAQGGPQYPSPSPGFQQNNYQAPAQKQVAPSNPTTHQRSPLKPLDVSPGGSSPLASPNLNQSPQSFRPATPSRGWAPVHSPVLAPAQPSWQQTTQYKTAHQSVSQQTFVGQQYQPTSQTYQQQQYTTPSQPQYQPPKQQYQTPQTQYQPSQQKYQQQAPVAYSQQEAPLAYQAPSQQLDSPQPYQASQFSPKPETAPSQVAPRAQPTNQAQPPPPSTITLRPKAPVSQASPPVFTSQPATATLKVKVGRKHLRGDQKWPPEGVKKKMLEEAENVNTSNSFLSIQGGKNLRGDLKWPPENVKSQAEEENRLRLELARGPAFRPKRPQKDYSHFFAQHALNSTYPGYKIPPGTQFFRAE